MMTLLMTINDLKQAIVDVVKRELRLPDGSKIDVQFSTTDSHPGEGEIKIKYSRTSRLTGAQSSSEEQMADDRAFVIAALRDAYEKMQFPFIGLTWFRDKYLPALGANLSAQRIHAAITALIARGELVLDKVPSINDETRRVTAIRTPEMPVSREPRME